VPIREPLSAHLVMVLFDDFTSEGDRGEAEMMLKRREREAAEIGRWLTALDSALSLSVPHGKQLLSQRLAETSKLPEVDGLAEMRRYATELIDSPDQEFLARSSGIRQLLQRVSDAALRHKTK
jgi:hypothetical protein